MKNTQSKQQVSPHMVLQESHVSSATGLDLHELLGSSRALATSSDEVNNFTTTSRNSSINEMMQSPTPGPGTSSMSHGSASLQCLNGRVENLDMLKDEQNNYGAKNVLLKRLLAVEENDTSEKISGDDNFLQKLLAIEKEKRTSKSHFYLEKRIADSNDISGQQLERNQDVASPAVSRESPSTSMNDPLSDMFPDMRPSSSTQPALLSISDREGLQSFLSNLWESQTDQDERQCNEVSSLSGMNSGLKRKAAFEDNSENVMPSSTKSNAFSNKRKQQKNILLSQLLAKQDTKEDDTSVELQSSANSNTRKSALDIPQAKLPKNLKDKIRDTPGPHKSNQFALFDKSVATSPSKTVNIRSNPQTNPNNPFPGNTTNEHQHDILNSMPFNNQHLQLQIQHEGMQIKTSGAAGRMTASSITDDDPLLESVLQTASEMEEALASGNLNIDPIVSGTDSSLFPEYSQTMNESDINYGDIDGVLMEMMKSSNQPSTSNNTSDIHKQLAIERIEKQLLSDAPSMGHNLGSSLPSTTPSRMYSYVDNDVGSITQLPSSMRQHHDGFNPTDFGQSAPVPHTPPIRYNQDSYVDQEAMASDAFCESLILQQKKCQILQRRLEQQRQLLYQQQQQMGYQNQNPLQLRPARRGSQQSKSKELPIGNLGDLLNSGMAPNVTIQRNPNIPVSDQAMSSSQHFPGRFSQHRNPQHNSRMQGPSFRQQPQNIQQGGMVTFSDNQFSNMGNAQQFAQYQQPPHLLQGMKQRQRATSSIETSSSSQNLYNQTMMAQQQVNPVIRNHAYNQDSVIDSSQGSYNTSVNNWPQNQGSYSSRYRGESRPIAGQQSPDTTSQSQFVRQELRAICSARSQQQVQQQESLSQYSSDEIPMELFDEINSLANLPVSQQKQNLLSPEGPAQQTPSSSNAYVGLTEEEILVRRRQEAKRRYEQFRAISGEEETPETTASNLFRNQLGSTASDASDECPKPAQNPKMTLEHVNIVQTEPRACIEEMKPANQKNSLLQQLLSDKNEK